MYTMTRCTPIPLFAQRALMLSVVCAALAAAVPTSAQVQPGLGGTRTFPDASLRGVLTLVSSSEATLNGRSVRVAPGMRLMSPQNTLVIPHSVFGQRFKVNYLIENSTGMLLTAWILTEGEAAQSRQGKDAVQFNFRTESQSK
jgi:hypothetical protein